MRTWPKTMADQGTTEQDINEIVSIRREKLQTLVDEGKDPFAQVQNLTAPADAAKILSCFEDTGRQPFRSIAGQNYFEADYGQGQLFSHFGRGRVRYRAMRGAT